MQEDGACVRVGFSGIIIVPTTPTDVFVVVYKVLHSNLNINLKIIKNPVKDR